jgi:hypothetical protein
MAAGGQRSYGCALAARCCGGLLRAIFIVALVR